MARAARPQPWSDATPPDTSAPLEDRTRTKGIRRADATEAAWAIVSPSSGERAPRRTSDTDRTTMAGRSPRSSTPAATLPATRRRGASVRSGRPGSPAHGTERAPRAGAPERPCADEEAAGRRSDAGSGRCPDRRRARRTRTGRRPAGGPAAVRTRGATRIGHRGVVPDSTTTAPRRSRRSKWRSTSAHTNGSSGPRSSSESGARASSTPATDSSTKRKESLETKPATCWSLSGRSRITSTEWAKAGYSGVGSRMKTKERKTGHDRLGHQVDGADHGPRPGDPGDPAHDR